MCACFRGWKNLQVIFILRESSNVVCEVYNSSGTFLFIVVERLKMSSFRGSELAADRPTTTI